MQKFIFTFVLIAITNLAQAANGSPENNWSSFYVGAHMGYSAGTMDLSSSSAVLVARGDFDHTANGGFGGIQFGANFPLTGQWVGGFTADYDIGNIGEDIVKDYDASRQPWVSGPKYTVETQTDVNYFGTLRANVGYVFGNTLVFVTGGMSYLNHTGSTYVNLNGSTDAGQDTQTHVGWVGGLGLEHTCTDKISVSGTWLYYPSSKDTYTIDVSGANGGSIQKIDLAYRANTLRLSINYHF